MNWPVLANPPIKEAIFHLRFKKGYSIPLEEIKLFCEELSANYPTMNEVFRFHMEARVGKNQKGDVTADQAPNGYRLLNKDKSLVLQFQLDGFMISKVEPYISWEELKAVAIPIVEKVGNKFPKLVYDRIALRYINFFTLKFEGPLNDYFRISPVFPKEVSDKLGQFEIRLAVPKQETNTKATVKLGIDPIANVGAYKTVFDIDVFKEGEYPSIQVNKIVKDFSDIRNFKNEIFFKGLTEKTLKLFD